MPKASVNYALAATLVSAGVTLNEAARQTGAANGESLRRGLARKGVTPTRARAMPCLSDPPRTVTLRLAQAAGQVLRESLGDILDTQAKALSKVPARANLKHITQVGQALEPLARTAKIVHDWGNETTQGIIAFGVVEQLDQAQDAIEVQSSVSDTPSNSVPVIPPDSTTTLD